MPSTLVWFLLVCCCREGPGLRNQVHILHLPLYCFLHRHYQGCMFTAYDYLKEESIIAFKPDTRRGNYTKKEIGDADKNDELVLCLMCCLPPCPNPSLQPSRTPSPTSFPRIRGIRRTLRLRVRCVYVPSSLVNARPSLTA